MKVFDVAHNMSTIKSHIKVRIDEKALEPVVTKLMSGFAMINALGRDDTMVMGMNISDVKIDDQFKKLVSPRSVNIDGTSRCFNDLIDHSSFKPITSVTYSEFVDAMDAICTWCKVSKKDRTPLTDLRKDMSLANAIQLTIHNGMVHFEGNDSDYTLCIPLTVNPGVANYYYNMTEDDYSREFWRSILVAM